MKLILIGIAAFCFLHIVRDYLQIKGVKNRFTQIGHMWDAPKYEIHGIIVLSIIGILCLVFFFKHER